MSSWRGRDPASRMLESCLLRNRKRGAASNAIGCRFADGCVSEVDLIDYLKEAVMRMKNPVHPGELVAANLDEIG